MLIEPKNIVIYIHLQLMPTKRSQIFQAILLLLSLVIASSQSNLYSLVLLPQERGAACLDGSPPGIYIHQGSGANKNKFMLYFNGGGMCNGLSLVETLDQCYNRTFGRLGSSKILTPTADFDHQGMRSTQQFENPVFYDWTKIVIPYCDGGVFSGTKDEPISYKDKLLHFRGYNNTMEYFRYLDSEYDFYNGDTIVVSGGSAGGIAVFLHSNYILQHTKKAKVYSIPDSGIFINQFYSPLAQMAVIKEVTVFLLEIMLEDNRGYPFRECLQEFEEPYHCYNAENLAKYFKTPIFMLQSVYDRYCVDTIVDTLCKSNQYPPHGLQNCNATERAVIQDYRNATLKAIYKIKGNRTDVGAWVPSCVQHCFTFSGSFTDPSFRVPSGSGPMVFEAIQEFLENPNEAKMYVDQVPWPYNTGCNGIASRQLSIEW